MATEIKLNFINESNDQNNSQVVFFQKNIATDYDELAVAWKVIENCATGWQHPFTYPMTMKISAADSWGNEIIEPIVASNGQLFHVFSDPSGDQLTYQGPGASRNEVQLRNDLTNGSIDAKIYKNGKLLAVKTGVSPDQKAVFQFKPTLWVGVVSQIEEGQVMNSAIISDVNTELGLLGVASADIVMSGGGVGKNATKFQFTLENIVYA
ncbi:hypothetical protein BZG02_20030 [Labilibaculum filiforme]|uniref:Aromatic ring-opening dioxygenase LigA n=1 Tax=Labilibaculum filiforme TaxID=1940526 RepID=A0A2N3HQG4_9BACT|nr:hypothetical protein [Labilibaculum filiforme]PKQ60290.1 hypothetical protein BZG02_20030 [Labilibaculum filiforme]